MNLSAFHGLIEEAEAQGLERFYLVLPRPCSGRRRMRVLPGLFGEVCCENADRRTVVLVRCDEARRWLWRNGWAGGTMFAWGLNRALAQTAMAWTTDRRASGPVVIRINHPGCPGSEPRP